MRERLWSILSLIWAISITVVFVRRDDWTGLLIVVALATLLMVLWTGFMLWRERRHT